jgi:hypothetical protein
VDTITLSRIDEKKDVVSVKFPSLPDRYRVHAAYRRAVGYVRHDEEAPSGTFDEGDAKACFWAAVGMSWQGQKLELLTFREHGRDVVAYGEAVTSALFMVGYCNPQEQIDCGRELYQAFMKEMFDAATAATADFPKAPRKKR